MAEIKWDIRRGAEIYAGVYDARLKRWISTGKIKLTEVLVWRSGFSGWRKPEDLEELIPFFKRRERYELKKIKRRRPEKAAVPLRKKIKDILIIEDEKDLGEILSDILNHKGYNVAVANTKKEGIARLKKQHPQLVFLDLRLPDGDGMKLLPKIKKINPRATVNVISAYGSDEARETAKKKGIYCFIDKPFTERQILRSIR